jgi:hypothetical protein
MKKNRIENPISFIDQSENTKSILNGGNIMDRSLEGILGKASEIDQSNHKFGT